MINLLSIRYLTVTLDMKTFPYRDLYSLVLSTPALLSRAEMMYEAQISRQICTVGRKLKQPFVVVGIMYVGNMKLCFIFDR